jgi:hypothetical protein
LEPLFRDFRAGDKACARKLFAKLSHVDGSVMDEQPARAFALNFLSMTAEIYCGAIVLCWKAAHGPQMVKIHTCPRLNLDDVFALHSLS